MIYHTEMYDEIYDLTIHKKDFFYAWNVIWKDNDVKFLIKRVIDLYILVIQWNLIIKQKINFPPLSHITITYRLSLL